MEQNSAKYHYLAEQDSLYIETEKTESEILYRLCFNQHSKKNIVFELKAVDFKFRKYSNNVIKKAKEFDNSMIITILMSPNKRYSTL